MGAPLEPDSALVRIFGPVHGAFAKILQALAESRRADFIATESTARHAILQRLWAVIHRLSLSLAQSPHGFI